MNLEIRPLFDDDIGYVLSTWRESHKQAPGVDRLPWSYYKHEYGTKLDAIVHDSGTVKLGAYLPGQELAGWLVMTPSKRVPTVHWIHTRYRAGSTLMRRQGVMTALIENAQLGPRFVYTLRGRKMHATLPDGTKVRSLDEVLVHALRARGVYATYQALKDWLK